MTPEQVGQILAAAAGRDARTVGVTDVLAWHEDIGDLDFHDALAAVSRHYRESTDRLMPAHVRRLAAEIARDRRRAGREAREAAERRAIEADPSRRDRSEEVRRLIAELREALPEGDPDKLRRSEVLTWERNRERQQRPDAEPNPHYDSAAQAARENEGIVMTDMHWRMNSAAPIAESFVGDLKVNRRMNEAVIAALSDEELLNLIDARMPVVQRYWNDEQRRVLVEEVRLLLKKSDGPAAS